MRFAIILFLSSVLLFRPAPSQSQSPSPPKREVRAVWITTAAGLDWPASLDRKEQQESLRAMVRYLHSIHFNTIFFQVRARGDAYYQSRFEPWAEQLTGTLGQNPGWDPLQFLLREAHAIGMEVHAWFNVYKVRGMAPVRHSTPPHPSLAHPEWCISYEGEIWMDPGIPAVRSYLLNVALDLVRSYPVDGVNFDFIRYPGREFPDEQTYQQYGGGRNRQEWRRSNINAFVTEFYNAATILKPMLKVGSSPLGIYDGEAGVGLSGSFSTHHQDAQEWILSGKHDYLAPQLYWNIGHSHANPDFALLARQWVRRLPNRHIYTGIAAYKPDVMRELPQQIDSARSAGAAGEAFFRLSHITFPVAFGGRYMSPALIPPMPWKDSIPPLPPIGLAVNEIATNVFLLEWGSAPPARDGDTARSYVIYRSATSPISVDDPRTIVAVVPASFNHEVDTVAIPSGFTYYYAISALDKGNNESVPSVTSSASVAELLALKQKVMEITSLSTSIPKGASVPTLIAYRLARRMNISLEVFRQEASGGEKPVATLARGVYEGGTYVLGLGSVPLTRGRYVIRLRAGETLLEQPVSVPR